MSQLCLPTKKARVHQHLGTGTHNICWHGTRQSH